MRPLIIDGDAREKVKRVLAHAQEHHYHPGIDPPPGDDDDFVAQLGTYRAVFSFTHADGLVYRHLTVSIPRADDKFAHPIAAFLIAELFGFTGYDGRFPQTVPDGWLLHVSENEHCVVIAQAISMDVPMEARQ